MAEDKKYILKTGLGRLPVRKRDGTEDLMLSIMNKKSLHGIPAHPFDSDSQCIEIRNNEDEIVEYIFDPSKETCPRAINEIHTSAQNFSRASCEVILYLFLKILTF